MKGFRHAFIIAWAAILIAACSKEPGLPTAGVIELSDAFTGNFALVDQHNKHVTNEDLKGKVQLIYFGFATCPDVCPLALGRMSAALNELSEKELSNIAPLFITVDPERDTPETLAAYLEFDPRIVGLTGSIEAAAEARESFKVYAGRADHADSGIEYTMDHSSLFYLVGRDGQPLWALQDYLDPQEISKTVRKALK